MDPAHEAAVKELLRDLDSLDAPSQTDDVKKGLFKARTAAGVLPRLGTALGSFGLGATAFTVGWKIGAPAGTFVYYKIVGGYGSTSGFGGSAVTSLTWAADLSAVNPTFNQTDAFGVGTAPAVPSRPYWILANQVGTRFCSSPCNGSSYSNMSPVLAGVTGGTTYRVASQYCGSAGSWLCYVRIATDGQVTGAFTVTKSNAAEYGALTDKVASGTADTGTAPTGSTTSGELGAALAELGADTGTEGDAQQEATIDAINEALEPSYDADEFDMPDCIGLTVSACEAAIAAAGGEGDVTTSTVSRNDADLAEDGGAVVTQSPGANTSVNVTEDVVLETNPDPNPITLPPPAYGETAEGYADRLRDEGFLGTITVNVLNEENAVTELGQSAPVRIRVNNGPAGGEAPTRWVYPWWTWPSPGPRVFPTPEGDPGDDPIQIWANPETTSPLPDLTQPESEHLGPGAGGGTGTDGGSGSGPGGGGSDAGDCPCPIHSFDFGPLTEIEMGDKFPFGIVGWLKDQAEYLDPPAEPPHIWVVIPSLHAGEWETGEIEFGWDFADTTVFDWYIGTIRTALEYLLWLGGLIYLGTRILKLRGAPDTRIDGDMG